MSDIALSRLPSPTFTDPGPLFIAGIREFHTFEERGAIPAQWQRFGPHIGNIPGQVGFATYGVCSAAGDPDTGFDYTAGVAVGSLDELPEELSGLRLPARRYAVFPHDDHVANIGATCAAIFGDWLPESGETVAEGPLMMIEHYDETFDPHTGLGGIAVWVPLKA